MFPGLITTTVINTSSLEKKGSHTKVVEYQHDLTRCRYNNGYDYRNSICPYTCISQSFESIEACSREIERARGTNNVVDWVQYCSYRIISHALRSSRLFFDVPNSKCWMCSFFVFVRVLKTKEVRL